jgi:hypothetical protein
MHVSSRTIRRETIRRDVVEAFKVAIFYRARV